MHTDIDTFKKYRTDRMKRYTLIVWDGFWIIEKMQTIWNIWIFVDCIFGNVITMLKCMTILAKSKLLCILIFKRNVDYIWSENIMRENIA